ncbi:alpha-(1-_6)-mannopyranosyltransferase A [Corynebacterium sp.]|uniref:alpha-(1->6)-mannopyranosyltransferase A n=1 Tax=Corynebacterium sp. TaxID=1720 RepID=UPI0026E0CB3F|nr:alpha-(1->6)-mannopyranosyltransferase A [Corynebacterium sp.]MDO5511205.1 alpha-(1->6)-mannopyranosyltransferase A [Corynebacterium sp.]
MIIRLPSARSIGLVGALLLLVGSFGGGAIRYRGGVLETLGLDFLAYGRGAGISNVVFWAGVAFLLVGWIVLGRRHVLRREAGSQDHVHRALWWWILPLIPAAPMLSRDVYSYLMQGAMLRDGFDPYTQGAAVNPGPFLLEVSHDWRNTTTPYGPLHLWIGEGVTRLVGDNVTAGVLVYKLISVLGFVAIAWAVPRIARALGGDPALALWLGVANPVMILHMVGGMHNESVMVGLVSVGLLACLHKRFLLGVALIAVAVSLKATAAIALPFVVWMATHHYSRHMHRLLAFVVTGFVGLLETLAVVAAVTWASGSSWGWLSEISGNSKVINPLALPSLLASGITWVVQVFDTSFEYNSALGVLRQISMMLMLAGLVLVWWLFRQNTRRAVAGTALAYQVAFVFNSVTLPWYYASVISLVGTVRPPEWVLRLTVGASIVVTLAFTGSGNHQLYNTWWMAGVFVAAWLLTNWAFRDDVTGPSPAPGAAPHGPADRGAHRPDVPAASHPQ